ncbi:hypothetical protein BDN70DRAFT_888720 [Pholiota conissans]|uniref:Uncharacterized protein n=1 Tax=Pholiota conissans TaxID=109636 RepID=A0A9P5YKX9_9AGAR|nr:hypothetical protein BDN70DRAFT_888720 [Pholiota conissans]
MALQWDRGVDKASRTATDRIGASAWDMDRVATSPQVLEAAVAAVMWRVRRPEYCI